MTMGELPSDTVRFQHPFFEAHAEGQFRLGETDFRPVFAVTLGEQNIVYTVEGLKREYVRDAHEHDAVMLDAVGRGLRFVKCLRIGDPLPPEILTGEASWEAPDKYRNVAQKKLVARLVKWSEGLDERIADGEALDAFLAREVTSQRVAAAIGRVADQLGPGAGGVARVEEIVEALITELAYLEAVRDKIVPVEGLGRSLASIRKIYDIGGGDSELDAVIRLQTIAVKLFRAQVNAVDASIDDVLAAISEFDRCRRRLRRLRDDLYCRLSAWDEILEPWRKVSPRNIDLGTVLPLVGDLYRFLAPRYMPVDEWTLASEAGSHGERRMRYGRLPDPHAVDAA